MKRLRVYVDTSVLGGCFDPEFAPWSLGLIEDFRRGSFVPVLSEVTAAEVVAAPRSVRDLHAELLVEGADLVAVDEEVLSLAAAYEARGILSSRYRSDMLHLAVATVAQADVLVSWNFRHIVRLDRIRLFNAVNIEAGYRELAIYSPREVTVYGSGADAGS